MLNYPNAKKKYASANMDNHGKRGMSLEDDINSTNAYYLEQNIAVVYKKPTPITVVSVDYKSRTTARITEAYYKTPSTTDYNGLYRGKYIDFEAKETSGKTSMPLSIIHQHQLRHLAKVVEHGGIAFLIIRFTTYDETYVVDYRKFSKHLGVINTKSVKYDWFKTNGVLIPYNYIVKVDYLKIVDLWIQGGYGYE